ELAPAPFKGGRRAGALSSGHRHPHCFGRDGLVHCPFDGVRLAPSLYCRRPLSRGPAGVELYGVLRYLVGRARPTGVGSRRRLCVGFHTLGITLTDFGKGSSTLHSR